MNQSKNMVWNSTLAYFFAIIIFCEALLFCLLQYQYANNGDFSGYCVSISHGIVSGWWAPLSLWEMRQVFLLLTTLQFSLPASDVFRAACCCNILLFAGSLAALVYISIRHQTWNCISACCLCFFAFYLSATISLGTRFDFFFLAQTTVALLLLSIISTCQSKGKWICSILYFICVFHAIDSRHNAILLFPLFLAGWGWKTFPYLRFRNLLILSLIGSIACVGIKKAVDAGVIKEATINSSHVMLLSDLRMAATLRGEYQAYAHQSQLLHPRAKERLAASYGSELVNPNVGFDTILKEYTGQWKQHPREMFMARLITLDQFFFGSDTAAWKQHIVGLICPAVQGNVALWTNEKRPSDAILNTARCTALSWQALSAVVMVIFLASLRRAPQLMHSSITQNALLAISLAIFYTASFIIATPSPDIRYHYPSLVLMSYGTPILVIALIRARLRREAAQLETSLKQ